MLDDKFSINPTPLAPEVPGRIAPTDLGFETPVLRIDRPGSWPWPPKDLPIEDDPSNKKDQP
jgi:hypothetical protein